MINIPLDKFEEWLANKNLKPRTINNYVYYFNKFNYDFFSQETVSKFLSQKQNRNSIARSFLVNLQKFLKTNYFELGLSTATRNRIVDVELPRITGRSKTRIINPLTEQQVMILEKEFDEEYSKLQLLLTYYCGLRLGELMKISIISFNWEQWKNNQNDFGECRVYGKGDKEGIALVPSFLMKRIAKYIKQNKFTSLNSRIFSKRGERSWQDYLRKAGIKSGITKLDDNGKPIKSTAIHPHKLRHSYATYLKLTKKLDLMEIKELMRHSSVRSTQIYTHIDKEYLKEKLK